MKALIIGVDGQDGYYLRNYLHEVGYEVFGVVRKKSAPYYAAVTEEKENYHQIYADLHDLSSLMNAVAESEPDEIYNLAGQSEIPLSWRQPVLTAEVNALGVMYLLEAIRLINPGIRFFQASSSELYGDSTGVVCTEETPFRPRNPYGTAKLFAHNCVANYREKYGIYGCCGILFNHESPRRGLTFVTRKITMAAAARVAGHRVPLLLGNLTAVRDWGYAGDYVRAMWLLLQQKEPKDVVIGTGEAHTVRDFASVAFACAGFPLEWDGAGTDERAYLKDSGQVAVKVDPALVREPLEDKILCDPTMLYKECGFQREFSFVDLVDMMVKHDICLQQNMQ